MSRKDKLTYLILYKIGKYNFHMDYAYRTSKGVIDAVADLKIKKPYYRDVRVLMVEDQNEEGVEHYAIDGELVPITKGSSLLYGS